MTYYIYKIVCNDVSITEFYVGSTTCFRKRKCCHKSRCNNPNETQYNQKIYQTIRENGGWDNWRMVILEEMIDATKIQAHIREEHYRLELGATLNMLCCGTGLTKEEYHKEYNKTEKYKKYNKEYRKTEKQKEYRKQYQREYRKKQKELKELINI